LKCLQYQVPSLPSFLSKSEKKTFPKKFPLRDRNRGQDISD
jgi:hypothetical protein